MSLPALTKEQLIEMSILFIVLFIFILSASGLLTFYRNDISVVTNRDPQYYLNILISIEFIFLTVLGLAICVLLPFLSHIKVMLIIATSLLLCFFLSLVHKSGVLVPPEFCALTFLVLYISHILISYFLEIHSRQKLVDTFSQYIPPHLVKKLTLSENAETFEGESKTLSVFFCDLQDFTTISEELNPKQLNKLLNEYFTVMTEILFRHQATIDKYIGDAIMAFWNAPTTQKNHAQLAVEAALEMTKSIEDLGTSFVKRGWPELKMGIGINTGRSHVGIIGSNYRKSYTAIGDAVNVASRIESLTRTYRTPIIIGENTYKELKKIVCRELDQVKVKGKHKLTRIYQPICNEAEASSELKNRLIKHNEALDLYYKGHFIEAEEIFRELFETDKEDKYYRTMVNKIRERVT